MADNDFIDRLADAVEATVDGLKITVGYLGPNETVTLCPLPGGQVIGGWMDGTRELSLPYEFGVKTTDQLAAYQLLGRINDALSELDLVIPSGNDSYDFESLDPGKPFLASLDEQGQFVIQMDITAKIITKGSKK